MGLAKNIIFKVGVLAQKDKKLLLIKEKGWKNNKYHWNIIKGTFDPEQDSSILAAAKREAREEAGVRIKISGVSRILYLKSSQGDFLQINFMADLLGSKIKIADKETQKSYAAHEDIVEAKLFSKKELKNMAVSDFIGRRAYQSVRDWIDNEKHPLSILLKIKDF